MSVVLYVGNKNYLSWLFCVGLCMVWSGIEYEEVVIEFGQEGYGKGCVVDVFVVLFIGKVLVLVVGDLVFWDFLVIVEWVVEVFGVVFWLLDCDVWVEVCVVIVEMYSGFFEI